MKNTVAAPILLVSASVMVCGLGIAHAQEQEQEQERQTGQVRPTIPQQTPRLPLRTQERLRPAIKQIQQNQERNQQQTPAKRGPRARGRGTNMAGAGGADGTGTGDGTGGTGGTDMGTGTGALGGTGGAGGATGNIQEFETGIDYRPMSPGARVTFNLEDADLPDLVRLISSITGKRFILPGKVRSIKATVYAPTKVTAAEAYRAFLSILELNGMTVVPSGRYLKIVETTGIESQPIPLYNGGARTPTDDRFVTRMHRVSNVSAEDVATLLSRFKTREGQVTAYAPTNTVILTDMGSNIRRMLRVLEAIDVPRGGEQVWIEPIHYVNASEMANLLSEIFPVGGVTGAAAGAAGNARQQRQRPTPPRRGQAAAQAGTAAGAAASGPTTVGSRQGAMRITKIIPDERSNSLIILATERAYLRILELIRQLDVPMEGEGGIHVHYVQHGDAEEIAGTLASLIGGSGGSGGSSSSQRAGARGGAQGAAGAAGGSATGTTAGAVASGGGGAVFEGDIRVTAHKPTNALVITSSLHDYAALRRVIERLDSRRRQVFIDAVIMEMSVNRSNELGVSWHGGAADVPAEGSLLLGGSNAIGSLGFPDVTNPTTLTGAALGVRGPEIPESQRLIGISIPAFGVALTALSTSGDTDILSTPHILAMDNEEAEISVGQNVPLQTSGFNSAGGLGLAGLGAAGLASQGAAGLLGGGLGGGFGNVPRQDVGTTLRITPHINESDEIRLEIEEEISEAEASTEGSLGVRTINKRTAKTQMVVRDQQTVVIGGLMRDTTINEETKVPVLGDIPLLGVLFRQTRVRTEKRNLLLFLTPYIIRDASDLRAIYERKMRERQEFIDRYFVFGDQDYEPHVDYTRTRGLVMEIVNELDEIAYETQLAEEALGAMPPEHIPRAAVGTAPADLGPSAGDIIITPDGPQQPDGQAGTDLPGSVDEAPPDDGGEG